MRSAPRPRRRRPGSCASSTSAWRHTAGRARSARGGAAGAHGGAAAAAGRPPWSSERGPAGQAAALTGLVVVSEEMRLISAGILAATDACVEGGARALQGGVGAASVTARGWPRGRGAAGARQSPLPQSPLPPVATAGGLGGSRSCRLRARGFHLQAGARAGQRPHLAGAAACRMRRRAAGRGEGGAAGGALGCDWGQKYRGSAAARPPRKTAAGTLLHQPERAGPTLRVNGTRAQRGEPSLAPRCYRTHMRAARAVGNGAGRDGGSVEARGGHAVLHLPLLLAGGLVAACQGIPALGEAIQAAGSCGSPSLAGAAAPPPAKGREQMATPSAGCPPCTQNMIRTPLKATAWQPNDYSRRSN